ncbi:MAG: S8 family serine peptidase [Burkholderiaceae bacterium]
MVIKRIRFFLLGISAAGALIVAMVSFAAEHATGPLKLNIKSISTIGVAKEEMISRLMVKPHQILGTKLAHALQLHDATALTKTANVGMTVVRPMSGGAHVIKLDKPVTLAEAHAIAARLMQDSSVELVEPDRIRHPTGLTPTDPSYASLQWHYFAPAGANKGGANLPNAWSNTIGSSSITVAVIDTGYRQHADLGTVLQGYDFIHDTTVSNDGDARDADAQDPGDWVAANECGAGEAASNSSWHGTHVTGTIAELMNNGVGGTGIAPNVKILPVRVLGKCGGYTSDIVDGMYWAAGFAVAGVPANAHPANILNLSLGGSGACSNIEQTAVTQIVNAGKVIVVASGNDGTTSVSAPGNCTGVIAVTAHAIDGDNAYYANIGPETAISAPGGGCGSQAFGSGCTFGSANGLGVYSLWNSGTQGPSADSYATAQGTSMATPHVAGVVALMLSVDPALTPAQIKSYLRTSARAHPAGTTCTLSAYVGLCGAGLLDAAAALTIVSNLPPIISLTNTYQVVAPSATVALSSTDTPTSGRSITTYAWAQLTGSSVGTISNANTANATFTAPATGTYTFQLTVTDSAAQSSTATATVHVNSPPVLTTIAAQTGQAGHALTFNVGATDVDGDALNFSANSIPSGATLSSAGVFNWASPAAGSYTMTYYANDGYVNSAQGSVSITIPGAPAGSGGGGSVDRDLILALLLLAVCLRGYRGYQSKYGPR